MNNTFGLGGRIVVRDAEWLVRRVDRTSSGGQALGVVGISELVRDKEAIFLTEIEQSILPTGIGAQPTGDDFSSKFLGRPHTRGLKKEIMKNLADKALTTGGDGTPIIGFWFRGRKSIGPGSPDPLTSSLFLRAPPSKRPSEKPCIERKGPPLTPPLTPPLAPGPIP
jgi:hypothetical protein